MTAPAPHDHEDQDRDPTAGVCCACEQDAERCDLARWHVYHGFRWCRREAIAERDQLPRIVSYYAPEAAQRHQEISHAAI